MNEILIAALQLVTIIMVVCGVFMVGSLIAGKFPDK